MMVSEQTRQLANEIQNSIQKIGVNYNDLSDLLAVAVDTFKEDEKWSLKVTMYIKDCCEYGMRQNIQVLQLDDLYWKTMKEEAPYWFESFLFYMEKNRSKTKRFYEPREETMHIVVEDLQDLENGIIEFYGLSLPPRVGKSTICIFFLAWVMGRHPNLHNAMGGHSGLLAKGFYKEALNLITSPEYTFNEIFTDVTLESKSADEFTVNLNDPDRFATLTCRGIDGTWTGAVDISAGGYLYVDDLIRDRTESLSPIRLENRYQDYLNVMVDRKNDGAKELMVGTRWNVMDPLGKNEAKFKDNPKARFRKIPALNENDESNFEYKYGVGFSTEYYRNIRDRLDRNEWEAKYQQRPFIREGLLFPETDLRFFNGILPEGGFVRVVTACDVAWGGGDSLSMPIGFEYENGDVYIVDWVFNPGTKEITIPIVTGKIVGNKIQQINFEANNGGEMYSMYVSQDLEKKGYKCSVTYTKAPNTMAKMAKIIQYSDDIKRRFVFLSPNIEIPKNVDGITKKRTVYRRSEEYQRAMEMLNMFVTIGKNEHDDAPDSLSQLEAYLEGGFIAKAEATRNPFS